MSGAWLISYVALWVVVVVVLALQLGTLRELGILRQAFGRSRGAKYTGGEASGPPLGTRLPRMQLETVNGHATADLKILPQGTRTMLAFLTPVCQSCQVAVEPLNAMARLSGGSLRVLVVLSGPDTSVRTFLMLFPLAVPVTIDPDHHIASAFAIHGSPFGLLYDEAGLLVRKGPIATEEELASLVEPVASIHASPLVAHSQG